MLLAPEERPIISLGRIDCTTARIEGEDQWGTIAHYWFKNSGKHPATNLRIRIGACTAEDVGGFATEVDIGQANQLLPDGEMAFPQTIRRGPAADYQQDVYPDHERRYLHINATYTDGYKENAKYSDEFWLVLHPRAIRVMFATVDQKAEFEDIVRATYDNWVRKGAGVWSGWCVPWASILHNRNHEPEAAVSWLVYWYRNYLNEGRGSLHDAAFQGMSNISSPGWHNVSEIDRNREKMQLDAGFGALSAVIDLLVYQKRGTVYVLPKIHRDWWEFDFEGIVVEGGFVIGAIVKDKKTQSISARSKFGGKLKLAHGLGAEFMLDDQKIAGDILEREFKVGEEIVLSRL